MNKDPILSYQGSHEVGGQDWDWSDTEVPEMFPADPNEGLSFRQAKMTQYSDALMLRWDAPGQLVELAPVHREGTRIGLCTAEGEGVTVPDIFDINRGG